ncbi:hypothetical protein FHS80_001444, partial [Porphyromonas circumdentaria]|nr:hypothetical protein [Porphyromonas circumdentaria]
QQEKETGTKDVETATSFPEKKIMTERSLLLANQYLCKG